MRATSSSGGRPRELAMPYSIPHWTVPRPSSGIPRLEQGRADDQVRAGGDVDRTLFRRGNPDEPWAEEAAHPLERFELRHLDRAVRTPARRQLGPFDEVPVAED